MGEANSVVANRAMPRGVRRYGKPSCNGGKSQHGGAELAHGQNGCPGEKKNGDVCSVM